MSADKQARILNLAEQHKIDVIAGPSMCFNFGKIEDKLAELEEYVESNGLSEESRNRIRVLLIATGFIIPTNSPKKAKRALEVFENLSDEQIEELMPVVKEAKGAMETIRSIGIELNSPKICADCNGACCSHEIEGLIEEIDFLYMFLLVSNDQRKNILDIVNQKNEGKNCCFHTNKGCAIPPTAKPYFCQAHFCEDILPDTNYDKTGDYDAWLDGKIEKVKVKLKEMGYNLN
ncbi:hypothetical protein KKA95_05360 [Patescibacteria group bacterium]|nr:hypothetical protein [Patescibacteria group bacterium]